ncbi:MAG: NUDIX domain-containing protein [candidate division NC10 bacterium]
MPAPAATLVLLRDRPVGPFEVLLIRRHAASKFAAGDFVFPGGKIEADDNPDDAAAWCRDLDPAEAARVLGLADAPQAALGSWIGAIRETFEEAGVLLAYGPDGGPARVGDARFAAYRRACHADNRAFWDMIRGEGFMLATDHLVYFAHWITPEVNPLRFDTRFFAAEMPSAQAAAADEREITEVRWLTVREAFDATARGELPLRPPTMKNLALFDGAVTAAEALGRLRGRRVQTIMPRVIGEGASRRVLMPGDPGYA